MEDGNCWISVFACNVMAVSRKPPEERWVVSKVLKELNCSGCDWRKWGMIHATPGNGQRKQRCLFDAWTPCFNLKRGRGGKNNLIEKKN